MSDASRLGWAVVTGAAGGMGAAFAHQLAERGHRLLLVDRRLAELEQVCESIAVRHGAVAEPCAVNLGKPEEVENLARRLQAMDDVELLVNNAGFGTAAYFADTDVDYLVGMVDVHVVAPTMLTRAVLPRMMERDRGGIINVSSLSAWLQSAGNVQYSATKCYLAAFSMALHQEVRGTNVRVQALCPGFVRTDFHAAESMKGFNPRVAPAGRLWMSPHEVVAFSLRRLVYSDVIVIPGLHYRVLGRLFQMPLLQPLMRWITRQPRLASTPALPAKPHSAPALGLAKSA